MSSWLVDQGHSRLKWAPCGVEGPGRSASGDAGALVEAVAGAGRIWLASVVPETARMALAERLAADVTMVTRPDRALPVAAAYSGLGVDRWLAFNALWRDRRRAFCLADIGSATTIDIVDGAGRHRGGWIAAGPETALAGLAARAGGLPAAVFPAGPDPATDTATALGGGTLLQQAGLVDAAWLRACRLLGASVELWLTGGGAEPVQSGVSVPARRDADLVLKGLYELTRRQT